MKIGKRLYYLAQWLLMAGASLTMGLLSFSGILAIWSSLSLAFSAFILTVAYEGQVYLENIIQSFKKIFKFNHLERNLAKTCLREHGFPLEPEKNRPQFFNDYERQLHLLHRFEDKRLDEASSERKRHVEKTLGDMEKWFSEQLFSDQEGVTKYQKELRSWLGRQRDNGKISLLAEFQAKRKTRHFTYQILKVFCLISGVFMGLGTTYLLVEAFAVIPWLAVLPAVFLPIFIVPMAAIAGVAYGLMVYNAMTDMIASEMVTTWLKKIGQDLATPQKASVNVSSDGVDADLEKGSPSESGSKSGLEIDGDDKIAETRTDSPKRWWAGVAKICVLSVMFLVSLALSICTAGTWWTVVKTTRPLFSWMSKIPSFIMLVLNPLILSVSTWMFNVENISETLEMAEPYIDAWSGADSKSKESPEPAPIPNEIITETWLQSLNPFRLFIYYLFNPLRRLVFVGHLMSIGATADQVPGVPPLLPAVLGAASEGVEDIHYFQLGGDTTHEHKHDTQSLVKERLDAASGHDHGSDLPTRLLSALFSPFYFLAACWDFIFSEDSGKFSSWEEFCAAFTKSWNKETGTPKEETVEFTGTDSCCPTSSAESIKKAEVPTVLFDITKKKTKAKKPPGQAWQFEQAAYRVERHKEKCLRGVWVGSDIAEQQIEKLEGLQKELYAKSDDACLGIPSRVNEVLDSHLKEPDYNKHRFFLYEPSGKTETRLFLEKLPARVAMAG